MAQILNTETRYYVRATDGSGLFLDTNGMNADGFYWSNFRYDRWRRADRATAENSFADRSEINGRPFEIVSITTTCFIED